MSMERALRALHRELMQAAEEAVSDIAHDLHQRSVRDAPVDKGDLRGAGYVRKDGDEWEVGFSGLPYIVVQHERTDFQHPKGGRAKFLEANLHEQLPNYRRHIARKLKGA